MKLLVTGASGFIGQHVLRQLAGHEIEIHITEFGSQDSTRPKFSNTKTSPEIFSHTLDLLNEAAVSRCLEEVKPTHLLHLAWYAEPGKFWTSPLNKQWQQASEHLVHEFYAKGGTKAVVAGSCAEYDWSKGGRFYPTTSQLKPATFYGQSKLALFRQLEAQTKAHPQSLAWGRVFWLYGEGEALGRLVSSAFQSLLAGQEYATTEGRQLRDFLHVQDVAQAFIAALTTDLSGAFNVSSGQSIPVRDLLLEIGRLTGRTELIKFGALPMKDGEPAELCGDNQELKSEGFNPHFTLSTGLARTHEWWRSFAPAPEQT